MSATTSAFDLPDRLAAKADPALIEDDERQFDRIAASLAGTVAELSERLDRERRMPGGRGTAALERDQEIHRLSARLRTLRRFGLDLCLGRMVQADSAEPVYVGRLALADPNGERLLIDWRSPAAAPFFGATHADPMGLVSRRRYRWTRGRVRDYWDEAFTADALASGAALDDQSAFIASLGSSRSPRMRDVLATIQADQDAIIRAGSRGALVVDGGPGTGKTVVALHRTAYLLYSDARVARHHGGVLFVGPSPAYLAYVDDVLPSLGEDGELLCTIRDFVPEGATAVPEADPSVARRKASLDAIAVVERAVVEYERPPSGSLTVETPWFELAVGPSDWAEAFAAAEAGVPHDDARDDVWAALLDLLVDRVADDGEHDEVPAAVLRPVLANDEGLRAAFGAAWPLLDPVGVVRDLLTRPEYLTRHAPELDADGIRALQRPPTEADAWTIADLPLLDAARTRIGEPEHARTRRRREAALDRQRSRMADVVDDLIAADDDDLGLVKMLRVEDAQRSLVDDAELPSVDPDLLAGPFAHIVVDEAQELTDAEWRMLLRRCPSGSLTIVGDRAQARHGFTESWTERLARVGLPNATVATLGVNYRTPEEVMAEAEPVIRAAIPDANVPTSIRRGGVPVGRAVRSELDGILDDWLAEHADGTACVIGDAAFAPRERVRSLTPETAKGLEFDLVVLVSPDAFGDGIEGAVDRYVAMTRATQRLVILT